MNTICRVGTERANAIGQVTSLDDLVLLGPRLVAVDDWELSHFLKLGLPPRSIAKHVAQYISAQRQLNTLGRKAVAAARRGDAGSAVRLSQKSAVFVRIQETEGRRSRRESVSTVSGSAMTSVSPCPRGDLCFPVLCSSQNRVLPRNFGTDPGDE